MLAVNTGSTGNEEIVGNGPQTPSPGTIKKSIKKACNLDVSLLI